MSKIELYNGDCLEVLKNIENNSINLVVVDLPFNQGVAYKTNLIWDKFNSTEEYLEWVN